MSAKNFHFKVKSSEERVTKADQTSIVAHGINETAARLSAAKTARLRELRLARDAEEAAAAAIDAKAAARAAKSKKKPAAKKADQESAD
ncbi:MAG: hypothetical protein Q7V31_13295 [Parvibaculum sp.]|uniref:hypothetical protein n=1 Tax=Parvibaculum sp. TaxID=2024848 RepID=UPI00271A295E|nr:hypothetical protein [Parvibaculum sp.]MDO8839893.1 hypothetical protein [Parvibaculum sp.]